MFVRRKPRAPARAGSSAARGTNQEPDATRSAPPGWVQLSLGSSRSRPRLGAADDEAEAEAEQVEAGLERGERSTPAPEPAPTQTPASAQRAAAAAVSRDAAGGGQPLASDTRATLEARLGHDLADVRVHQGPRAHHYADVLAARAFSYRNHIWLGRGQSTANAPLMAHEATHVLQQRRMGADLRRPAPIRRKGFWSTVASPFRRIGSGVKRGFKWAWGGIKRGFKWLWKRIRGRVHKVVKYVPGYQLLAFAMRQDPITRKEVPRTAGNLIRGLLGVVPGLSVAVANTDALVKVGAGIVARIVKVIHARGLSPSGLWKRLVGFVKGFKPLDFLPHRGARKVIGFFVDLLGDLVKAFVKIGRIILEELFEAVLGALGKPGKWLVGVFKRAKGLIFEIAQNPRAFVGFLAKAFKLGFAAFTRKIRKHLKGALFEWLFGSLGPDIAMPRSFSPRAILSLVLQVVGLSWETVKARLIKHLKGKPYRFAEAKVVRAIAYLERGAGLIADVVKRGPIALLHHVEGAAASLKRQVIEGIRGWAITQVVFKGVEMLLAAVVPGAGFVKAAQSIFRAVRYFFENWRSFETLLNQVFASLTKIARGQVAPAAESIHQSLARGMKLALGFLASVVLGPVGRSIRKLLEKLRKPIIKVIDRVVAFVARFVAKLVRGGRRAIRRAIAALGRLLRRVRVSFGQGKTRHTLYFKTGRRSVDLMIRSTPLTLETWLAMNKQALGTHYATVANKVREIDKLKWRAMSDDPKDKRRGTARTRSKNLANKIAAKTKELATLLASLKLEESTARPKSRVRFKPRWRRGSLVGQFMVAEPLSLRPGNTRGTGVPTSQYTPWFKGLKAHRPRAYVSGHLLNHEVHGPGTMKNLVPISASFNALMQTKVEGRIKDAVVGKNEVVSYRVKVLFGRHDDSDPSITEDERALPVAFVFTAHIMKPKRASKLDLTRASSWRKASKLLAVRLEHRIPTDKASK